MTLRLTHIRLRAEWIMLIIALALLILYTWYCGTDIRAASQLYSYEQFEFVYHVMNPIQVAESYDLDVSKLPERADLRDVYNAAVRAHRGWLYALILNSAEYFTFPALNGMAVVLLCMTFRKRRIGQFLSAGYSRLQVFLSLTLPYFAFAVLLWLLASFCQLSRYHISFSPEEGYFFRTTQLTWLCNILFNAALAYLFAMLLRRPAISFVAAMGVRILLLILTRNWSASPLTIIQTESIGPSWDPGMDLSPLITGNWITLGFLTAVLAVVWLSFRKRRFEA
jgi:hypothetical protein